MESLRSQVSKGNRSTEDRDSCSVRSTETCGFAVKDRKKHMTEVAILEKIETLNQALARLQQRVEDLEDLRDLEQSQRTRANR